MSKLFCTFGEEQELDKTLDNIVSTHPILYNKIFVLITDDEQLAITYTPDTSKRLPLAENTILVHRKKHTNTLYSINAMNIIIRKNNNGMLDKNYQVNWENYQNKILLSNDTELNQIPTKIFKIISL